MTREARQTHCPEAVLGWIPWYGEGTLSETQEGAVEAHAAECAACRAELDMIAGAPFEIDADLPDPDLAFAALTARIAERAKIVADLEESQEQQGETGVGEPTIHEVEYESMNDLAQLAQWALEDRPGDESSSGVRSAADGGQLIEGPWSRSSTWAAAAACLLVSLGALVGALYSDGFSNSSSAPEIAGNSSDPEYALAAAGDLSAGSGTGPLIDVVFRETTSAGQISGLLRDAGAEIVSGPSSLGVYRIRLDDSASLDEATFVSRLRSPDDGLAIFAEAVP